MTTIPPQLAEAGNGALLAMLAVAIVYFGSYIARAWRERAHELGLRGFYTYENKAAVALMTCTLGLFLHVGSDWISAHLRNHGLPPWPASLVVAAYMTGTVVALWGFICLMRALARYDWPRSSWIWLGGGAILFGVFMAL